MYTDVCEFNDKITKDNKKYFITFIDNCCRYCYVYLLKIKNVALNKFLIYKSKAETQTSKVLKRSRSNRGGEYMSNMFQQYCQSAGIVHEVMAHYSL